MNSGYWSDSRAPRYSLLFALPLLLAYETLAFAATGSSGPSLRNGADVLIQEFFVVVGGRYGPALFWVLLTVLGVVLIIRDRRHHPGPLAARTFVLMSAESCALAVVCGVVVGTITTRLVQALAIQGTDIAHLPLATRVMLSLGAGLYEELLFRVVLVSALAWFARRVLNWRPLLAGAFAVIVGALVFSFFHYIGPYADQWQLFSFAYRAIAGVFFSALYLTRGFGITAWTHALYDILVLVAR